MITKARLEKHLNKLISQSATTVQANQKYLVPCIATNDGGSPTSNHIQIDIHNVETYRYDGRWYNYRFSADNPIETFGILKVDNIFTTYQLSGLPIKHFVGTLNRLVFQDMIKPFILLMDDKIVPWDRIEFVYDNGETWLKLYGETYNFYALEQVKNFKFIIFPYKCEFFGEETDELFELYWMAFSEYLQKTSYVKNKKFYIASPTLNTEYCYNFNVLNIGGWCMSQIKRYKLGLLSDARIKRLRNFNIFIHTYDDYGNIIDSTSTKYNLLDTDVPSNTEIYEYLYGTTIEEYREYPCLQFTNDGFVTEDGDYHFYITDPSVGCAIASFNENVTWDLSEIPGLLFRENFLIFKDGIFDEKFEILTAINNVTYFSNPDERDITVMLIYSKDGEHVIRLFDKFIQSYMTEQAKLYFEAFEKASSEGTPINTNQSHPLVAQTEDKEIEDLTITDVTREDTMPSSQPEHAILLNPSPRTDISSSLDAHTTEGRILRGITAFSLDTELAFVPSVTDYVVFISRYSSEEQNALDIIEKVMEPLDLKYDKMAPYEEIMDKALQDVIDYDVTLLNPLYHTAVDQHRFYGKEANQSLIYQFMYESRRGIKIPRKRYKDHETYFMIFVNGELFSGYYKTICYANFFFIPVDEDFSFADDDIIEILYFKYVNNNEIRFYLSDWLLDKFKNGTYDARFFQGTVFEQFIRPKDLKVFSHYPRDMIKYPTLITEESEDIAFNISYRDDNNDLYIKKDGLTHIVSEDLKQMILDTGQTIPDSISDALDDISIDTYKTVLKDNTFIQSIGVNIFDTNHQVTRNALVAVSSRKFIYQRLFVECESYRIKLDKRFRYCDNPRQYLLFINGRRMRQDGFLVTIPKHTLPFTGLYLYTAKFVKPTDRVELFYLPCDMTDINFDEDKRFFFKDNGYFEFDRTALDIPLSKDFYLFFINGKKIPASNIIDVDSNTIRVNIDTTTLHYPMITAINMDTIDSVSQYMQTGQESKYDALIQYIKNRHNGYEMLDKMLGAYATLTDVEDDKIWMNVAKIAILNEVIRDFWVTSGYEYHKAPFIYDYDTNEYFEKDEFGNLILPALDARPEINIKLNDISLLYFYTDPENLLLEYGAVVSSLKFFWEYSLRFNQPWQVIWQRINQTYLPVDARTYEVTDFSDGDRFVFEANTGQQIIRRVETVHRANGTYWGLIPAEALEYYRRQNILQYTDELLAVIPYNKQIPPSTEQEIESGNPAYRIQIEQKNALVYDLTYVFESELPIDLWMDPWLQNVEDYEFLAIFDDGTRVYNPQPATEEPRPDRMDDLLYTFPCAILEDKRFVCDLEIAELHNITDEPDTRIRDFNILNDGFMAEIDGRDPINDMVIVKDKPFLPPDDTVYDLETYGLFVITLDDHRVLRDMKYDGIQNLYPKLRDLTNDDFILEDSGMSAIIHSKKLHRNYHQDDFPPLFLDDFISDSTLERWYDIIADYKLPDKSWPVPEELMVFEGICGMFDDNRFVDDIDYIRFYERRQPDLEQIRDFLIQDDGFMALVSEVQESPSIRYFLEPIEGLMGYQDQTLADIRDQYLKVLKGLNADLNFRLKYDSDDLVVSIDPYGLTVEPYIEPLPPVSEIQERDFLLDNAGLYAFTEEEASQITVIDLDTGEQYDHVNIFGDEINIPLEEASSLRIFNHLEVDLDLPLPKLPSDDLTVTLDYVDIDGFGPVIFQEPIPEEKHDTLLIKEYGISVNIRDIKVHDLEIDLDLPLPKMPSDELTVTLDYVDIDDYETLVELAKQPDEKHDILLIKEYGITAPIRDMVVDDLEIDFDLPLPKMPSDELTVTLDYVDIDDYETLVELSKQSDEKHNTLLIKEYGITANIRDIQVDDLEADLNLPIPPLPSDDLTVTLQAIGIDDYELVTISEPMLEEKEETLLIKEYGITANIRDIQVDDLEADLDLPIPSLSSDDLTVTLDYVDIDDYETLVELAKQPDEIKRDFIITDDSFMAIMGELAKADGITITDLDTNESFYDQSLETVDTESDIVYTDLWAIIPNTSSELGMLKGLDVDFDLPLLPLDSEMVISPEALGYDAKPVVLLEDSIKERDFLLADDSFMAIMSDLGSSQEEYEQNALIIDAGLNEFWCNSVDIDIVFAHNFRILDLDSGEIFEGPLAGVDENGNPITISQPKALKGLYPDYKFYIKKSDNRLITLDSSMAILDSSKVISNLSYTTELALSNFEEFYMEDGQTGYRVKDTDFYAVDLDDGTRYDNIFYDIDGVSEEEITSTVTEEYIERDFLLSSIGFMTVDNRYLPELIYEDIVDYPAIPLTSPSGNVLYGTVINHEMDLQFTDLDDNTHTVYALDSVSSVVDVDTNETLTGLSWIDLSGEDLAFTDPIDFIPEHYNPYEPKGVLHVVNLYGNCPVVAIIDTASHNLGELSAIDLDTGAYIPMDNIHAVDSDTDNKIWGLSYTEMGSQGYIEWDNLLTLTETNTDVDNNLFDMSWEGFEAHLDNGLTVSSLDFIPYYETYTIETETTPYLLNGVSAYFDDGSLITDRLEIFPLEPKHLVLNPSHNSFLAITDSFGTIEGLEVYPATERIRYETETDAYLLRGIKALINSDDIERSLDDIQVYDINETFERYWLLNPSHEGFLAITDTFGIIEGLEVRPVTERVRYKTETITYLMNGIQAYFDDTELTNLEAWPLDHNPYREMVLNPSHDSFLAITDSFGTIEGLDIQPLTERIRYETETDPYLLNGIQAYFDDTVLDGLEAWPLDCNPYREITLNPSYEGFLAITNAFGTIEGLEVYPATERIRYETETAHYLLNGISAYFDDTVLDGLEVWPLDYSPYREMVLNPSHESFLAITDTFGTIEGLDVQSLTEHIRYETETDPYLLSGLSAYFDDTELTDLEAWPLDYNPYREMVLNPSYEGFLAITDTFGTIEGLSIQPLTERIHYETETDTYFLKGIKALVNDLVYDDIGIYPLEPIPDEMYVLDPTNDKLLAIVDDIGMVSGLELIPLMETHRIDTVIEPYWLINTKAMLEDGTFLDGLTYDMGMQDGGLLDPSHEAYFALLHDGSGRLENLDIIWEPNTHIERYDTEHSVYDINYNIMAVVQNQTGSLSALSMVDLDTGETYRLGDSVVGVDSEGNILDNIQYFDDIGEQRVIQSIGVINTDENVDLNVFNAEDDMIAIMYDGSSRSGGLFYILEEKPKPLQLRNFFNLEDGDYIAYTDTGKEFHDISYIVDQDPTGESYKKSIFSIDARWMMVIYPEQNDRIIHEKLWVVPNEQSEIRYLPFYMIDTEGFSIITKEDGFDKIQSFPGITWIANEYSHRRSIGYMDFMSNKDTMMAILNGNAQVLHGVDYMIDGQMDNNDLVVFEWNDTIFAITMDGRIITDFTFEDHAYSWSNQFLVNLEDEHLIAILEDGRILQNLRIYYDASRPDVRHFYDESQLPILISFLEKHLIPEPPSVHLSRYEWGNRNYFVFACPKRVVYKDWHCLSHFSLPDPTSSEVLNNCFAASTPIYTDGKINEETHNMTDILDSKMEYMGECKFTNMYGYTETYMVWKSNGFFTRLNANAGLDIDIKIGDASQTIDFYNHRQADSYSISHEDDQTEYIPIGE